MHDSESPRLDLTRSANTSPQWSTAGSADTTGTSRAWPDDDVFTHALHHGTGLDLVYDNGARTSLAIHRWLAAPDAADETVLARCSGHTLDVGCGPGRFCVALMERGAFCLGIDVTPKAVTLARSRGANALCASIFDPLPDEGLWDTVLLADGNLGIAGDPDRLLTRAYGLLRAGGALVIEVAPHEVDDVVLVQLWNGAGRSGVFHWAHVGSAAATRRAEQVGFKVMDSWTALGRSFLIFER